jgi:transcriptional regulator GlxA family with amidase domain
VTFWYAWLFNYSGGSGLITLVSHAAQGTITIGGFWSASVALAQANLLFGVAASTVAVGSAESF